MTSNHALKFSVISNFFRDNNRQLQRGETAYVDGHVLKMIFDPSFQPAVLKGVVQASMKNKNYDVEILIDFEDGITQATCSCPRGATICHHMAALCIYAHYNISSTDQQCAWNAPKPNVDDDLKTLKELYPPKRENYLAVERGVSEAEIAAFRDSLETNVAGFSWLLKPEPSDNMAEILPQIEEILISSEYLSAPDKRKFLLEKCAVTEDTRKNIVALTVGQATNENWLVARKYRLTASHFANILGACRRNRFSEAFYKNLLEGYDLDAIKAVQWGRENEGMAKTVFTAATDLLVTPTGLWLHPCGILGASPDGLVGDDALLEIKCPFKYRNMSLREALLKDRNYIIYKDPTSNETKVNEKHSYWDQIQGQLHIAQKQKCYLVVWTPQECEIVIIPQTANWAPNITILKDFYFNNFVPYISHN